MKKETVKLTPIQGHLILLCKGHYKYEDLFDALKKIWAIRCGWDWNLARNDTYTYIANDLFEILSLCKNLDVNITMENIHRSINDSLGKPENLLPIQALIWEYRCQLSNIKVRETNENGEYYDLITLPESNKELFERIIKGEGKYDDYKLF
jgi:hypothetical protein